MRRLPCLIAALALAAGAANAADAPAPAAKPAPVYTPTSLKAARDVPRTRDGHPDFQGVVWDSNFFAPLQAQPKLDLVVTEAQAKTALDAMISMITKSGFLALDPEAEDLLKASKGFPIVRGQRRSRLVVLPADGKLPLTPEGVKASRVNMATLMTMKADNPEDRMPSERCISLGAVPPVAALNVLNPWEFVQTRDYVVIHTESGDEMRLIPFAKAHGPAAAAPPMGDSIARWEGDTLVVETTNFRVRDRLRLSISGAFVVNPDAKVTERFTRLSKDELLYQFTVEDPKIYAGPWLAEYSVYRAPYRMFPSSCHEGNYSLPNILAGGREDDRVAAAKAAASQTTAIARVGP